MMTTLIQNCSLLDSSSPKGYIEHQDILICDHRIAAVQSTGAIANSDRVIDGQGLLALPGLINSHTHSPENILRATVEQLHLELWLVKQFAHRANFPLRLIYLITLAGTAEMIRSGTTAVLDHFWMAQSLTLEGLDAAMHAYSESGMRVGVAPLVEDQNLILEYASRAEPRLELLEEDPENRAVSSDLLVLLQDFFERWHLKENGRLKCLPGPGGPQWCSRHLLQGCLELAQQFNTGFHLHLAETCLQSKVCLSIYGRPAILELEEMGILGPNTSIAHGVWISDDEISSLARTDTTIVHNPVSNLRLGSGIAPIPQMLARGVDVALGTDGAASNDNQNMFTAMKLMGLLHSPAIWETNAWLSARQVIESSTLSGAKVLGYPNNLGRISKDYLADLVLLDLAQSFWTPATDAMQYLVFCETGSSIKYVIIDGKVILDNGTLATVPEKDVHQELKEQVDSYFKNYPQSSKKLTTLLDSWKAALDKLIQEEKV